MPTADTKEAIHSFIMPLYLATHTVEVVTAKVSLTMIMLTDHVKRKAFPDNLKLRMVLPTGSTVSVSIWDASSAEDLLQWLQENLQYDAVHEVHEVQEEFSWGISFELARLRAAEKVAAGGRGALDRIHATAVKAGGGITKQLEALDQRTNILTAAENAFTRMRTAATGMAATGPGSYQQQQYSSSASGGGGMAGGEAYGSSGDQPASATTSVLAANMSASFAKASKSISWFGNALKEQIRTATNGTTFSSPAAGAQASYGTGYAHQPHQYEANEFDARDNLGPPPAYEHVAGGGAAPGSGVYQEAEESPLNRLPQLPVSSPPAPATPLPPSTQPAAATAVPDYSQARQSSMHRLGDNAAAGDGDLYSTRSAGHNDIPAAVPPSVPPPSFTLDDDDGGSPARS